MKTHNVSLVEEPEHKVSWKLVCPNCSYKAPVSEFPLIDKETLLLQCPNCSIFALFP